jgi:hypothetical protein
MTAAVSHAMFGMLTVLVRGIMIAVDDAIFDLYSESVLKCLLRSVFAKVLPLITC